MGKYHFFARSFVPLFILLISVAHARSQVSYCDFQQEAEIRKKAEIGLELWNEFLRNDLDSLKIMSVELLLSAAESKNAYAKAVGNRSLGSYLIRSGQVVVGLTHLKQAETYFLQIEDYTLLSETKNEIGHAYYLEGAFAKASKAYLAALRFGKRSPDVTAAFNGKLGLGKSYCSMGDTTVGLFTIEAYKSAAIQHKKYEAAADAYAYMAMIEMDRGDLELSREYYEKSIELSGKSRSKAHLSHALNNKAILHFNAGEMDSCLIFFERSLRIRQKIGHEKGMIESHYNIGSFYLETGDFHNAYLQFTKSANLAKEKGFNADELDALVELKSICGELGYTEEELRTEKRLRILKNNLDQKKVADDEIIAYAREVVQQTKMEEVEPVKEELNSSLYIWMIAGTALIILIAAARRRRSRK